MSLKLSFKNPNYCATVVELKDFKNLEGCENVKAAIIMNNQVIVSNEACVGQLGLFFPVECELSHDLLKANNLYRDGNLNSNTEKKGYFSENRRVRCVKLRGHNSEGLFLPITCLEYLLGNKFQELSVGSEFDSINGTTVCCKYVVPDTLKHGSGDEGASKEKAVSRLVEGQVALHFDTTNLKKNVKSINPTDIISISNKVHGTSWVVGNLLVQKKLKWYEKLLIKFGVSVVDKEYDIVYASRSVIRNMHFPKKYTEDPNYVPKFNLWKDIAKKLESVIPKGFTLYGEAIGWEPTGKPIQKRYAYGFPLNTYGIEIYRITYTNIDGVVAELGWEQMKEFCEKNALTMVKEIYYGKAIDYVNDPTCTEENFHEKFLAKLTTDIDNKMCPRNDLKVPLEGWVVRKDGLKRCNSFKFKNILFVEGETKALDKGDTSLEDLN